MFIAPLFAIAKAWKQPQCDSTAEHRRKMWNIYIMEYHSAMQEIKVCQLLQHG